MYKFPYGNNHNVEHIPLNSVKDRKIIKLK